MKKIFLLVTLSLMSFCNQAQNVSFLPEMRTRLENSKAYTLKVAEGMPTEGYGFKPVADEMSFSEQLLHMAQNITNLTASYLTEKPNPIPQAGFQAKGKSKAEVEQIVTQAFDYAIEAVGSFNPDKLEKKVNFFAGPMSKRQIIMLIADHQTHHRAQLIVYLRLKGIKPPPYVG